jgi:hypothetical protein
MMMMIIAMFHNSSLVIIVLVNRNIDVCMCGVYARPHAGVFYCGSAALAKELRQLGKDFSHKSSTKFDFHKENF